MVPHVSEDFSRAFGRVVRGHREQGGLSQEELAARAGIHRTYVSSIELGKVRLGLDIAKKVADGLGVALSILVAETERPRKRHGGQERG
jgi:transcriptional regulator with XRE-family HTH domain